MAKVKAAPLKLNPKKAAAKAAAPPLTDEIKQAIEENAPYLDSLDPDQREVAIAWLVDTLAGGGSDNAVYRAIWEMDYARKPVGIDTFIEDPIYFGHTAGHLEPCWKDDLKFVFGKDSQVTEWVMTGALGVGKTSTAAVAIGYLLYRLSCLRDPAKYYGLLPKSKIVLGLYSVTLTKAADTVHYKLLQMFNSSEYFRTTFARDTKIDSIFRFKGSQIEVAFGSRNVHAMGLDLFGMTMDEVNFMEVAAKDKQQAIIMQGQAEDLYDATATRIKSRFMSASGKIPGMMILMSSRAAETSFLERRIQTAAKRKVAPWENGYLGDGTYLSNYALWEAKPKDKYPGKRFRVSVGTQTSRSRILADDEAPGEGAHIVEVPPQFRQTFENALDQSIRDIAGRPTFGLTPLIHNRDSVALSVRKELVHPFTTEWVTISEKEDYRLEDYYKLSAACRIERSRWVPKLNPNSPRYIHVDHSLSGDSGGIAMVHPAGLVTRKTERPDGTFSTQQVPYVIVDFMVRVVPPSGAQTDLSKIRSFILYLRQFYNIRRVTFDGFQSADSMQILRKAGLEALLLSVDRNDEPYTMLRAAHSELRIARYAYPRYDHELLHLQHDLRKHKVDHPSKFPDGSPGGKDVSDAVCGSVYGTMTDETAFKGLPVFSGEAPIDAMSKTVHDPAVKAKEQADKPPVIQTRSGNAIDMSDLRKNLRK